ncbi:hypothetical protein LSAT2_018682 [Lamellibrachia satsuma]|nr:hypothetical protein LSAT2_018682 [Lamellibrachia satsuma]
MKGHELIIIIAVSGAVSLVSVIIFALICAWCYQAKTGYDDDDDDDMNSNTHLAVTKRQPQREDLRQLSTHPYEERQNAPGLFGNRKLE